MNVLQGAVDKSGSGVGCVEDDVKPAKKLCTEGDMKSMNSSPLDQSVNTDESAEAIDGGNMSLFIDMTALDDNERLPQSLPSDERFSTSRHFPTSPPAAQELCLPQDGSACSMAQQLMSDSCTVSPPESPTLHAQPSVGHSPAQQGMNGVCDVSSLRMQYRNAVTTTGCRGDGITEELMSDDVVHANGFALLEPEVAGVVVNGRHCT